MIGTFNIVSDNNNNTDKTVKVVTSNDFHSNVTHGRDRELDGIFYKAAMFKLAKLSINQCYYCARITSLRSLIKFVAHALQSKYP